VDDTNLIQAPDGKKYTWFELEPRSVIVPFWAWKELKVFIVQNCMEKKNPGCDKVPKWDQSVSDIDKWLLENYK